MSSKKRRIQIKVLPKTSENRVVGFDGEVLKIKCRAVPENGRANEAVISLLAAYFDVPKSAIAIIKGQTSRCKVVEIS